MKTRMPVAALATVLFALFAPAVTAQKLEIDPGTVLVEGETARIDVDDPGNAGKTIEVTVTSNGSNPHSETISVTLDAAGKGSAEWVVPDWLTAAFTMAGVNEIVIPIVPPVSPAAPRA